MVNNKFFMVLMILLILPISTLATTPTLINSFEIEDGAVPNTVTVFDNYLAVGYLESAGGNDVQTRVRIYNIDDGSLVYQQIFPDQFNCGVPQGIAFANTDEGMYYSDGVLYIPTKNTCGATISFYFDFLDVSDIAFIDSKTRLGVGEGVPPLNARDGQKMTVLFDEFGDFTPIFNRGVFRINSTYQYNNVDQVSLAEWTDNSNVVDKENGFFAKNTGLWEFDYSDYQIVTLAGTVSAGRGVITDYNNNPLNPQYITNMGYFVLTGGSAYNDIKTSTINLTQMSPLFFFERGNIVGVSENNTWISADATDLGSITYDNSDVVVYGTEIKKHLRNNVSITVLNVTDENMTVYSVPTPDIQLGAVDIDTPPTVEADFLGVDISGDFIFSTEMSDADGGRVYLSQSLYEADLEIGETFTVTEHIGFNDLSVLDRIRDLKGSTSTGIVSEDIFNYTEVFDNALVLKPFINDDIFIDFNKPVSSTSTDTVDFYATTSFYDDGEFGDQPLYRLAVVSTSDEELFKFEFEGGFFGVDDTEIILVQGASRTTVFNGAVYDVNGNKDIYVVTATINFTSQTSDIVIKGANQTFYNGTVAFTNSATTIGGVAFTPLEGNILFNNEYYFANLGYEYSSTVEEQLDYTIFEDLESGVALVKATRIDGNFQFGNYNLYSYGTDEDFGFGYTDSFDIESFTYTEETTILTEDEIGDLVSGLQTTTTTGFSEFIEGDIFTDSIQTAVDNYGFKSTASKMFLGMVLILIGIAIGFKYGVVGSIVGAIGGLIISFFMGWIPTWIVVTLVLTLIAIASMEARKLLVGGR